MNAYFKLPIKNLLHHKKRSVFLLLLFLCCIVFFLLAMYFLRLTDGYFRFQEIYNLNARTFAYRPQNPSPSTARMKRIRPGTGSSKRSSWRCRT